MKVIKKKIHGKESRALMMEGINQAANVTGSTLGAKGRNVILDKDYGSPLICNDGITIIRELFFDDPIRNMGVQLLKDASSRVNDLAGDGTTGTVVLARAIVENGWQAVENGSNPVILRREIEDAAVLVGAKLKEIAEDISTEERAIQVASISVQDKILGQQIGRMMFSVGVNGAVTIKNSIKKGVYVEKDGGMRLEGQMVGGVVENAEKWETKFENAKVLILKEGLEDHEFESKWLPLVRQFVEGTVTAQGQTQVTAVHVPNFVVIAEKLPRRVIMFMNGNKDVVKWAWFRPTTAGKNMKEIYKDLQSILGGMIADDEDGAYLQKMTIGDLGVCESAICGRHDAVFTVSEKQLKDNRYLDRVNDVKKQIDNAEDEVEQLDIRDRYANLTGGVASIKVAASTEQDTVELRLRIEDAINATRSAMQEGIVSGGGVALLNAVSVLKGSTVGEKVMKKACEAAIRQILHNAGYDEAQIDKTISSLKEGQGVDVLTDKKVDMKEAGIIDPLKVIRLSLENAVSVAGLLLTSEYAVTNEPDETDAVRKFFTPPRE